MLTGVLLLAAPSSPPPQVSPTSLHGMAFRVDALPRDAVPLGDRIEVRDISIRAGNITVEFLDRGRGTAAASTPFVPGERRYRLDGGRLAPL